MECVQRHLHPGRLGLDLERVEHVVAGRIDALGQLAQLGVFGQPLGPLLVNRDRPCELVAYLVIDGQANQNGEEVESSQQIVEAVPL